RRHPTCPRGRTYPAGPPTQPDGSCPRNDPCPGKGPPRTCSGSVGGIRGISSVHILAPPGCANQYLCVAYWKSVSRTSGIGRRTCGLKPPATSHAGAIHGSAGSESIDRVCTAIRIDQLENVYA